MNEPSSLFGKYQLLENNWIMENGPMKGAVHDGFQNLGGLQNSVRNLIEQREFEWKNLTEKETVLTWGMNQV